MEKTFIFICMWEAFVILMLIAMAIHQGKLYKDLINTLKSQNNDFMNRLMAKNFGEYASGTSVISPPITRVNLEQYLHQQQALQTAKEEPQEPEPWGLSVG